MATSRPKSGVTEYTSQTGSGSLTLTGAAPGFRGFVSADDGLSYHYAIYQEGTTFEVGIGTYNHASRQLTRTTILANINGTTVPLVLGGGVKEVSIVVPGERVAMLDVNNSWAADQTFNSNRIYLDDGNSWIEVSIADVFSMFLSSSQAIDVNYNSGLTYFQVISTNESATEGPVFVLRRDTNTPAANDALGAYYLQGRDSSGAVQNAGKISGRWISVTPGSHSSRLDLSVASAGALQTVLTMFPSIVSVPAGIVLFSAGKTATSLTTTGAELLTNGSAQIVCLDGNVPLRIGKAAGNGTYVEFYDNGVINGNIFNTSSTITYAGFTGSHYGDFQSGVSSEHEQLGTVLAGTGKLLTDSTEPFYELVPAVNADRRVLGVWGGRHRTAIMGGEERDLIVLFALGNGWIRATGSVAAGDLLCASPMPGVAWAQPDQDQIGPWTVAKATNDSPDDGDERLISCIYMAG